MQMLVGRMDNTVDAALDPWSCSIMYMAGQYPIAHE